jgi:hypothetical protein
MKKYATFLISLSIFLFVSCEKTSPISKKDKMGNWECGMQNYSACSNTDYEDPNLVEEGLEVHVFEPLVVSNECNCIVSGAIKYVKNKKTVALVYYGNGDCDNQAKKILCVNGDCKDKYASVCYFAMNCESIASN